MFCYTLGLFFTFFIPMGVSGVFGANTDEVKSLSVTEGDSVTLNTDVTEVQSFDQILWMFGHRETRIAEMYRQDFDMFDSNETFGDRLKMDSQTGSLTITDIRNEHSGLYKLNIISSRRANSYKKFSVTVYALPVPVIINNYSNSSSNSSSSASRCSVLCSVVNVSAVSLSWFKGNSVLSSISVSNLSISLSLPLEVEYQDKNTYSCVANDTFTTHTTHLDIQQLCQTDKDLYSPFDGVIPSLIYAVLGMKAVTLLTVFIMSNFNSE
ncbi:uncharacterized protein LOC130216671 [Danio aesculapii]|uniref:uncharacterized protein LOC130216671 n=1 Tax=Danio aesculapii TaxID=1142201 RepID=UPI0024C079EA|nr:uncharacterized protein LOC130216671 [Danio aesculapii]